MGYDRGDSFPSDFKPNGIPFGSKSKATCHHDHIPFNVKGNGNIVFSVHGLELNRSELASSVRCMHISPPATHIMVQNLIEKDTNNRKLNLRTRLPNQEH